MAALETRAHLVSGGDYDLCPMGLRQASAEERARLVAEFFANQYRPQIVIKPETGEVIGVGFEIVVKQRATIRASSGEEREIEWSERRLAFRSCSRAEVEAAHLAERVASAHSQLCSLNHRKQGKRLLSSQSQEQVCAEIVKRHRLSERQLKGLYAGQPSRATSRPTTELMLKAFEGLSLVVGKDEQGRTVTWLKPLSELQKRILDLLGFSHDIYLRLVTNFQNLAPG